MEPKFQSSFIPKGPMTPSGPIQAPEMRHTKSLFGLIASLIFTIAALAAFGVYGYNFYLSRTITGLSTELEAAHKAIDVETIKELMRLDARIASTRTLINKHVALSPLFDYLEKSTLKTVRFNSFSFEGGSEGGIIKMEGQARGYGAVALQSDIFDKSTELENVVFSDLDLDDRGNVVFSMSASVNPDLLIALDDVKAMPASTSTPSQTVATSTATSTSAQATSTAPRTTPAASPARTAPAQTTAPRPAATAPAQPAATPSQSVQAVPVQAVPVNQTQ